MANYDPSQSIEDTKIKANQIKTKMAIDSFPVENRNVDRFRKVSPTAEDLKNSRPA